jgi:hypothetical protein
MSDAFIYFITIVIVSAFTAYITVILKDVLGKKRLNIVLCTITPLHYNVRTGGWTHTLLGVTEIHSYRLRVVVRNPGDVPRGVIDLSITWHLKELSDEVGSLNPKFVVASLINVPPKSLEERRFVIEIPSYYVTTDDKKPFTISFIDDNLKPHNDLSYVINPSIRKKPTHHPVHCNTESEGFIENQPDLSSVPDDPDPY